MPALASTHVYMTIPEMVDSKDRTVFNGKRRSTTARLGASGAVTRVRCWDLHVAGPNDQDQWEN